MFMSNLKDLKCVFCCVETTQPMEIHFHIESRKRVQNKTRFCEIMFNIINKVALDMKSHSGM